MSKSKILESIRNRPNSVKREELVSLLKKYGFVLRTTKTGGKGSHDVFKHPDHPEVQSLTIPRHNKLKSCYVKKAVETIDIMENDEEEIEEEIEETEEKPEEENEEPRT